jgi:flavoprotein
MSILKSITNALTPKRKQPRYYIPYEVATSQTHQMLITLINEYPNAVATWVFNTPEHGIMNQWEVCRLLRKRGVNIECKELPHVNRFKRETKISFYQLTGENYQFAVELERKMRKEAKNV